MSQRISIHTINLSELTVYFGSRDEAILRAVAERLQKEGGGPVLDNDTTDKPEGVQEYTFDFFVAAREIIRGTVHPGNSLPEESQAMVNAVFTLANLQKQDWADMEGNGDWKSWASMEYQEAMSSRIDQTINQLLKYIAYGRPFFARAFHDVTQGLSADEYYGHLRHDEVICLAEYMRAHPFMLEDDDDFGKELLSGLESIITAKKDLWLTVT